MCKHDEKLSERFYCLNRKQLGEYWRSVNIDCDTFCLEKFDHCDVCKEFLEVFENLQDSNFLAQTNQGINQFCGRSILKVVMFFQNLE